MPNEYECDICHQVFQYELSDEEAEEQFKREFPDDERDPETDAIVCDECYKEMFPDE